MVLSTTIDKYCYISLRCLPPFFENKHRIVYSKIEMVNRICEIKHPAVGGLLEYFKIDRGVEIHHDGDLPARSGLGSSSAFTVGLLHALYALKGVIISKEQLAKKAIYIERDILKENVGSQDQVAVAYGGFNKIIFKKDGKFIVEPVTLKKERLQELQRYLLLIFTSLSRFASKVAADQIKNTSHREKELTIMQQMTEEAVDILNGNKDLLAFGKLLHRAWKLKKSLSSKISNPTIDAIYEKAVKAGAIGGKLL